MEQRNYTKEERKAFITSYWLIKDKEPRWSLRKHSNLKDVRYYTARDWYRSKEYNPRIGECARGAMGPSLLSMAIPSDCDFVYIDME